MTDLQSLKTRTGGEQNTKLDLQAEAGHNDTLRQDVAKEAKSSVDIAATPSSDSRQEKSRFFFAR